MAEVTLGSVTSYVAALVCFPKKTVVSRKNVFLTVLTFKSKENDTNVNVYVDFLSNNYFRSKACRQFFLPLHALIKIPRNKVLYIN